MSTEGGKPHGGVDRSDFTQLSDGAGNSFPPGLTGEAGLSRSEAGPSVLSAAGPSVGGEAVPNPGTGTAYHPTALPTVAPYAPPGSGEPPGSGPSQEAGLLPEEEFEGEEALC